MANWKKLASGAAGAAGGAGLNVEDVFRTYLYQGNGSSSQTITTDVDLSTDGGMVYVKRRDSGQVWMLHDSEMSSNDFLMLSENDGITNYGSPYNYITSLNTTGFTVGNQAEVNGATTNKYCSWSWKKAPKFFDLVTYTGNGSNGRTISHNLGGTVGMMWVKRTDGSEPWRVFHRSLNTTSGETLRLTEDDVQTSSTYFNSTAPTDSVFTVGTDAGTNWNGQEYVAYLFAHHNNDGGFGPSGDQDIIKCGTYTGNGDNTNGKFVDLGFEPQWLLIKRLDNYSDWHTFDVMRGIALGSGGVQELVLNNSNSEGNVTLKALVNPTGFTVSQAQTNTASTDYIYMAIRRGPLAPPESATDVFDIDTGTAYNTLISTGFDVDFAFSKGRTSGTPSYNDTRLQNGKWLRFNDATDAEGGSVPSGGADYQISDGYKQKQHGTDNITYMWRRAPKFFDVVPYKATGSASLTVNHNLGAVPEMMWLRRRNGGSNWRVYHKDLSQTYSFLYLNSTAAENSSETNTWPSAPTDTQLTIGNHTGDFIGGGDYGLVYLFGTVAGVSKVGSYTGNGSTQSIDCGFSSGARFVLIKNYSTPDSWYIWDTTRGIVAGNDPYLRLNTTGAESSDDWIDPDNSGFALPQNNKTNENGTTYIFYAIA